MGTEVIYSSEYIIITKQDNEYYIKSLKKGMRIEDFNKIIESHPEIRITSYFAVKNALLFAPKEAAKFGETRERINIEISNDELKAFITLNVEKHELSPENRVNIVNEIINLLKYNGITFGIKTESLASELYNNKKILVAEGIYPIPGKDSAIKMYELKKPAPTLKEDGKADHYNIQIINRVNEGDWLGERINETPGVPGRSIKGTEIPAPCGKRLPLFYDEKTVREVEEEGRTVLYSRITGAVNYEGEKIKVSNHIEINGNVDFRTGNITVDGYVTINGTVEDGFSVVATHDIEILDPLGIGKVKEIQSLYGNIVITGGISGKGQAVIRADGNIYTKYVSDATVICNGNLNIGYYCMNSKVKASEVIIESTKGKIIGGEIEARYRVVSPTIGSPQEIKTFINITGFDREALKEELETIIKKLEDLKNQSQKLKIRICSYNSINAKHTKELENIKDAYLIILNEIKKLSIRRMNLTNYLKTKGEGEISAAKKIHPGCTLQIKGIPCSSHHIQASSFYYSEGDIKNIV